MTATAPTAFRVTWMKRHNCLMGLLPRGYVRSLANSMTSNWPWPAVPCRSSTGNAPTVSAGAAVRRLKRLRTSEPSFVPTADSATTRDFPRPSSSPSPGRPTDGPRILLARNHRFPNGRYSVIAGFVEPGESLEECAHREVYEEVGLRIRQPPLLRQPTLALPQLAHDRLHRRVRRRRHRARRRRDRRRPLVRTRRIFPKSRPKSASPAASSTPSWPRTAARWRRWRIGRGE